MAVTTTPLGFRKPDGNEPVTNGDNEIAANAQKSEDRHQEDRGRLTAIEAVNTAQDTAITAARTNAVADAQTYTDAQVATDRGRLTTLEGSAFMPAWKASTAYLAGQRVIAPNGDVVSAKVNFTSGGTYSATNWDASTQDGRLGTLETAKWLKPTIGASGSDANNLTTSGYIGLLFSATPNLPAAVVGSMEVFAFGTGVIQRYTTWETVQRVFTRRYTGSVWGAWTILGSKWDNGDATSGVDVNTLGTPGLYSIVAGSSPNLPVAWVGTLEVRKVSAAIIQTYWTWETTPRLYARRQLVGGVTWEAWAQIGGTTTTTVASAGASMKITPLAVTAPGTANTEDVPAGSVRWPLRFAVPVRRFRVHIRNYNPGNSTATTGAVSFTGLWLGARSGSAMTGTVTQLRSAFTTATDGSEYVTGWINATIPEATDMFLSTGWTNTAGQQNQVNQGGCYRSTTPADAAALNPSLTISKTSPFDLWIEAEVPATTPIVGGFGDSNTIGTGSTLPVHDSWLAQYCRRRGALPYILAQHGSAASEWGEASARWGRYGALPGPDSAINFLGQNDLSDGVTLADMQTRFNTVVGVLKSKVSPNVYLATITPANAKSGAVNTVRQQYNTWLGDLPGGARGLFDFSGAISSDDTTIRSEYNYDGLHYSTTGHAALADVIEALPVSPDVLTPGQVASLKALIA